MTGRERLSATVEPELLAAGRAAVADGRAESLSAWVNDALRRQADHDRRMKALDDFLETYEAEHGEITEKEMQDATRRARSRAVVVRAPPEAQDAPKRRARVVG
jgi:Fic family protein